MEELVLLYNEEVKGSRATSRLFPLHQKSGVKRSNTRAAFIETIRANL